MLLLQAITSSIYQNGAKDLQVDFAIIYHMHSVHISKVMLYALLAKKTDSDCLYRLSDFSKCDS